MASIKLILLIVCALFISISSKKTIEVHFESLCPGCQDFIQHSFTAFSKADQHSLLADVVFYPYGNAYQKQSGNKWVFTCQHGSNECFGNLIETCAVKKFNSESAYAFLSCLETNIGYYSNNFTNAANYCLTNYPADKTNLWNCVQSDEGNRLQHEVGLVTERLKPAHQYVPWIVVDGVHDANVEDAILNDLLGYLCQDQTNIAACEGVNQKFLFEKFTNKCYVN